MTQIENPKRKLQKKNDYQRHKLFRKIKRRRKAQAEAEQQIAEKQLRKKLKLPKFDTNAFYSQDIWKFNPKDYTQKWGVGSKIKSWGLKKIDKLGTPVITRSEWEEAPTFDNWYQAGHYQSGKDIHIKKSKRGTFTKAAKQHGMSVQSFANKVLRNPSKYSAAMRKKANFAHNAASWKH